MYEKIYLSPSSQRSNKYAVGNTNEQEQCRKIAAKAAEALKRCGFDAKAGLEGTMYTRVAESNAWGANAHIPIHTNACDGKVAGFRGFYFKSGGAGHKLLAAIEKEVAPITPGTSDGLSAQPGLYEVKASNAPCAYLELGFHDNPEEAQYIIDHTDELAEAICKGACAYYGHPYIAPESTTEPGIPAETVYTVVKGDALSAIAAKFGTTYQALATYNGIANPNLIYVGQQIKIPGAAGGGVHDTQSDTVYTVVKGETLSAIAAKFGTTYQALAAYNGITDPNLIYPGQKIKIPGVVGGIHDDYICS